MNFERSQPIEEPHIMRSCNVTDNEYAATKSAISDIVGGFQLNIRIIDKDVWHRDDDFATITISIINSERRKLAMSALHATGRRKMVVPMNKIILLICLSLAFAGIASADFSLAPYLYSSENAATIDYKAFTYSNSTAKIVSINGNEALLLLEEKMVSDRETISLILTDYYTKNFYPSDEDMASLRGYADAFNDSRNAETRYGPAEKTCRTGGTFLDYKPCDSISTCMQTAMLVCYVTGSEGCIVDLFAQYILDYKNSLDALDAAYVKFDTAYRGFGPTTTTDSLNSMDAAFNDMKTAADKGKASKLIYPESYFCGECLGVCPEPRFDYAAITSGKNLVSSIRDKVAPFATLQQTVEKVALSTQDRIMYREGEEKSLVFLPKLTAARAKFGGLKAQAVEAKALVSDTSFVAAADAFLSKDEQIQLKFDTRDFTGFESLLSSYETSGKALAAVINDSTTPYQKAISTQDDSGDLVLQAQWRVNRLSPASISSYNTLAERKNKLDDRFKPPMSSTQYVSLESDYQKLATDSQTYVDASASLQDSFFGVGNALGRASVDGAMTLAASVMPVSFKTRQSMATYAPPLVLGVIDLSILAVAMLAFVGVFYYFHGFFRSKLAISGWVLALLGFVFVLLIGSVGFYSIVLSTEKFTSFTDFMGTVRSSDNAAVIVREEGAPPATVTAMRNCADQVEAQLKLFGIKTSKYYINGNSCKSMVAKEIGNSTDYTYEVNDGLTEATCLDNLPDVPVFELQYGLENAPPTFTTVAVKQAVIKGTDSYYAKKPMCDVANVLG